MRKDPFDGLVVKSSSGKSAGELGPLEGSQSNSSARHKSVLGSCDVSSCCGAHVARGAVDGKIRQAFGGELLADERPGIAAPCPVLSPETRARLIIEEGLRMTRGDYACRGGGSNTAPAKIGHRFGGGAHASAQIATSILERAGILIPPPLFVSAALLRSGTADWGSAVIRRWRITKRGGGIIL